MRTILFAGLLAAPVLFQGALAATVRADGLIYWLPADGTSVRYDTELTFIDNGQEQTRKGSLTISSVGQTTVDNEKCRWIEFRSVLKNDQGEQIMIAKCLIPEKDFGEGQVAGRAHDSWLD